MQIVTILGFVAASLTLGACVPDTTPTPRALGDTPAQQAAPEPSLPDNASVAASEAVDLSRFTQIARPESNASFIFALTEPEESTGAVGLRVLEERKTPDGARVYPVANRATPSDQLSIALTDAKGRPLREPKAILAIRLPEEDKLYRVYVFGRAPEDASRFKAVVEMIFHADRVGTDQPLVSKGRVFLVPVHDETRSASLSFHAKTKTLFLTLTAELGGEAYPIQLRYNIDPESKATDPTDIQLPPRT